MNKRYLISLLHKYLKGNVTDEERKFVEDYYNVFSAEKDVIGVMSEDELLALENVMNRNIIRDGYETLRLTRSPRRCRRGGRRFYFRSRVVFFQQRTCKGNGYTTAGGSGKVEQGIFSA